MCIGAFGCYDRYGLGVEYIAERIFEAFGEPYRLETVGSSKGVYDNRFGICGNLFDCSASYELQT